MNYIDPADWPAHLREALLHQGDDLLDKAANDSDRVLAVARLVEQLRLEVPEHAAETADDWRRAVVLADNEGDVIDARADEIVRDLVEYLDAYSATPDETDAAEAYATFQRDLAARHKPAIVVRLAFAIIRSIEINGDGVARFNRERFKVGITEAQDDDGNVRQYAEAGDSVDDHTYRVWRAAWIIRAIRYVNFANLLDAERDYVELVAQQDVDKEIGDSTISTLEYMLIKAHPNEPLISTDDGRPELERMLRDDARSSAEQLLANGVTDNDDRAFLSRVLECTDDELTPGVCANVFRLKAEHCQPTT